MATLTPGPDDRGIATNDPLDLSQQTHRAWSEFRDAIDPVDIDALTRVKRRPARAVIAKVGDWPESRQLPEIVAAAMAGETDAIDQDAIDERVVAAHQNASRQELLAAIDRARDSVADWIAANDESTIADIGLRSVGSPLGELPVLTYLHAAAFQLAIAARDMDKSGAQTPDTLLVAGLRALVDTTGALAARMGIDTTFAVVTPIASVITTASNGGWLVADVDPADVSSELPGLQGDAGVLLDVAAGRRNPVSAIRSREFRISQVRELLRLAPIAQKNPGLPGGPVLRSSARIIGRLA